MTRPVDKSSSPKQRQGSAGIGRAIALVEQEAARRCRAARSAYTAGMRALKAEYDARQNALATAEKEEVKRAERWCLEAVAKLEGRPVTLADVRSVKREDVVKSAGGVSLPRVACLEARR